METNHEKIKREIEYLRDHWEQHTKGANYLMVAHGAALIACLSVLKDYQSTPQLKGVGILIVLVCIGFASAVLGYAAIAFARALDIQSTYFGWERGQIDIPIIVAFPLLLLSLGTLLAVIIIVAIRFASL